MAENPLLPNTELQALRARTKRCVALEASTERRQAPGPTRSSFRPLTSREALLAATTLQLQPGDLLLNEPGDSVAASLAPSPETAISAGIPLLPASIEGSSRLLLATAMAAALRGAGTDRVILTYTRAGAAEPDWSTALTWAQERLLPLLVICGDPRGPLAFRPDARARKNAFEWGAVRRAATRLQLPILTVDGEDAVAVYRTLQESVLRARSGGGPTLLWAMLPSPRSIGTDRPAARRPLGRLDQYLRARKIPFRADQ